MARCEDYPCCGHTDGLPCDWKAPDYASIPHGLCDHENGICEEPEDPDDDEGDGYTDEDEYDDPFRDVPADEPVNY